MTGAMRGDPARRRPGPLLAPRAGNARSLFAAVAALSLAAALIVIGAVAAGRAAEDWRGRLIGSATVVVRAAGLESPDAAAARAAEALSAMSGVARAWPLEAAAADSMVARLVEGGSAAGGAARLVAVTFKAGPPPSAAALSGALRADGLDAGVDDHRLGSSPILRAAVLAGAAAAALLAALLAAVGALAAFATRRHLAARRDLVDLLRVAGAADGYIGRLFAARSVATAAWAGVAGAGVAALGVAGWRLWGAGQIPLGVPPPAWSDLASGLAWPLIAALAAALAARLTVRAALKRAP